MKSEPVFLRALEHGDVERTLAWHNDAELYESLGGTFRFVSREAEEEWIRRRCAPSRDEVNLAICVAPTRRHIGNIYLRDIDWVSRRGEVHVSIGEKKCRSKGYGTSALRQLARHAFATLGLQRLFLFVQADNAAAIRAYRNCGFEVEGTLKRHVFKDGRFKDMLVMGLCRPSSVGETA